MPDLSNTINGGNIMNSKALLVATALFLAMSAVSCGKEDGNESDVSISLSEQQTSEKSTSEKTTTSTTEEKETTTEETTTSTTEEEETTTTETTTTKNTTKTTTASAKETSDNTTTETTVAQVSETTTSETSEQQPEDTTKEEETSEETQAPENPQPTENNNETPVSTEPAKFKIEDLLNDASGIIATLGTPNYSGGGAACLTNGYDDKIYQYDGLEIQCYVDGDIEYIFQINITGGDYQTDKGIKVGSTRAEVESAYGAGTVSGNMIVYSSGDNEMDIKYEGDTVASIFFYAPA